MNRLAIADSRIMSFAVLQHQRGDVLWRHYWSSLWVLMKFGRAPLQGRSKKSVRFIKRCSQNLLRPIEFVHQRIGQLRGWKAHSTTTIEGGGSAVGRREESTHIENSIGQSPARQFMEGDCSKDALQADHVSLKGITDFPRALTIPEAVGRIKSDEKTPATPCFLIGRLEHAEQSLDPPAQVGIRLLPDEIARGLCLPFTDGHSSEDTGNRSDGLNPGRPVRSVAEASDPTRDRYDGKGCYHATRRRPHRHLNQLDQPHAQTLPRVEAA